MLARKPRRIVYRRPPLTQSQRAAYYGLPTISSIESEDESKESYTSKSAEEKENFQVNKSVGPSESSITSFTMAQSALDLFNRTKRTTTGGNEEEEPASQRSQAAYPNESSIASFTMAQSALDLFNRTKRTTTGDNEENEPASQRNHSAYPNESSISSFTMAQSALDLFNRTKKTTTTTDDEQEEPASQRSHVAYQSESSIASFTMAQSALDLFNRTKKTTTDEEEDTAIGSEESPENVAEASDASDKTTVEPMEVDDPPLTPKRVSHGRQRTPKPIFDPSIFAELPKQKESIVATSTLQPKIVAAPSKSQPIGSRASLLLPRFMQATTSSNARASTQPVSCASPKCGKKSSPLTSKQFQVSREANLNHPSNQKARFTPKKSIAIVRRIADQSFNAAKLPTLDMSNYEGIPRAKPVNDISNSIREGKRAHPVTPRQPKMSSTLAAANKERFNQTAAFKLLQGYESPITPRVAPKRFTPHVETIESSIESAGIILKEVVLQTPSPSREDVIETAVGESTRKSNAATDIRRPLTADKNFMNVTLREDEVRRDIYDNDAGNFSALSIPDEDEEQDNDAGNFSPLSNQDEEQDLDENIQPSQSYDNSIFSINTPGPSRPRPIYRSKPSIPLTFNDTLGEEQHSINDSIRSNGSLVKIVAGLKKNQKQKSFCLAKKKIIKPETPPYDQQELRRSKRNRVHTLRRDLGQEPVYEYDENGFPTLVDVTDVEIKDPRAIKYLAVDKAEQNQKERELKKRQKTRKEFAKQQREREKELEF